MRTLLQIAAMTGSALAGISEAKSQFITDHNLMGFIQGKTFVGVTTQDKERWTIRFDRGQNFVITFTNGTVGRGHWQVQGRKLELIFARRFPDMCRNIFVADDGRQEWRDCRSGNTSSHIVSPIYDRAGPDLNVQKAKEIAQGMDFMRGMTSKMPIADNPVVQAMIAGSEAYLTREARRLLSPESRRLHSRAALETFETGRPSRWDNPLTGEAGGYRVVDTFKNDRGHDCKRVISSVTVKGEVKEEEQVQCKDETGRPYAVG